MSIAEMASSNVGGGTDLDAFISQVVMAPDKDARGVVVMRLAAKAFEAKVYVWQHEPSSTTEKIQCFVGDEEDETHAHRHTPRPQQFAQQQQQEQEQLGGGGSSSSAASSSLS